MSRQEKKILLIGPLPNLKANKIGGARVAFSYLYQYLQESSISYDFINSRAYEIGIQKLWNPFYIFFSFLKNIKRSDLVIVNVSHGGSKTLAPILFLLTKLFRKQFIFRVFGGRLKKHFEQYNFIQKWIFKKTIFLSDIFIIETKELYDFFKNLGANTYQLLNARNAPNDALFQRNKTYQKRFIFLGHVKKSKGIDQILEAHQQIGEDYTIHIYGPIKEKEYQSLPKNIYQGVLAKEKVLETLSQYDVLLLPTFFEGEGHPGAIIEAYSLGIPVITTNWRVIPEIVKSDQTGILIKPHSTTGLIAAIQFFNTENYASFSLQSQLYFKANFQTDTVMRNLFNRVDKLNQTYENN